MTTTLAYRPIRLDKHEARLLEIEAGRNIDDPIRCRLINVKITEDLEFIGLSALWGNADDTESIWIVSYLVLTPGTAYCSPPKTPLSYTINY